MAFFPEAKEFVITGGTFTSHAHGAEGEKGTYSFVLSLQQSLQSFFNLT
jgi:hypothetical protein